MSHISFTIGYPKLIHHSLIAILVDLQSTVIFTTEGEAIGWIHAHNKHINFAIGYEAKLDYLIGESILRDALQGYSVSYFEINGNISTRQWCIKTSFIYPPLPQKPHVSKLL